jgi:NhaP-type Na+/H+ or K+/H+ antiporter
VPKRFAGACALIVFAFCLVLGIRADNTFSTTVGRALVAMAGTFAIGLALGWAAQRMLDENIKVEEQKLKSQSGPPAE